MATTIKDIARRLSISTSTVSYALNGGPRTVPDQVRRKVLDLAKEMDYRPNRVARSLVTRTANAVGVVPPSTEVNVFLSPFIRLAWNAIANEAEAMGQDLLLFTGHNRNSPEEPGAELLDGRIDSVVFIAPRADARALPFLLQRGFPFTSIASAPSAPGPRYTCDNTGGVRSAVDHLFGLGHSRIAHVTGNPGSPDALSRADCFRDSMEAFGLDVLPEYVQHGAFTVDSGYAAGRRLLSLKHRPSAIFVANDEMAYGLCQAIREAGLDVPRDISIVGFDDCDFSYAFNPPITTVRQPIAEMAAAAVRGAVTLANGDDSVVGQDFATRLVIRESTAPLAQAVPA